jgi:hypothetical protein
LRSRPISEYCFSQDGDSKLAVLKSFEILVTRST